LGLKSLIVSTQNPSKSGTAIAALSFLLAEMDKPIRLPKADAISAQSNLNSIVFTNIVDWIGIDSAPYAPRFVLIDKTLLETRNGIAHGKYLVIDPARFESLADEVLELLRWFKTDVENAVANKSFLRDPG
jgi:MAE_28990/MAE_18760-like HEPN